MAKKILISKGLFALVMALLCTTHAAAWDTEPNAAGKYDKYFDRPTHFPDWSQPTDWPNNMAYFVAVKVGKSDDRLENYEVAVYDQNDKLRCCARSYAGDGHLCSLTIMGTEGDTFRFEVIYGDDFDNPTIEAIPELTVPFKTNFVTGNKANPYWLRVSGATVLDETSDTPFEAETGANVRVKRTINANEWGTICLPFAMSEEQVKAAFGDDVKLGDFTGYEVMYDDKDNVLSIQVNFSIVTAMESNHPYIIKVSSAITEFGVKGVDIITDEEPIVATVKRTRKQWSEFIGNYENGFLVPEQTLFLSGGKFWYSVGSTPMMAFRGYFDFYDMLPEAEAASARIGISITDETDGITSTYRESCQPASIYTLDGRKVSSQSSDRNSQLKKGIYIIGGKKQVIK